MIYEIRYEPEPTMDIKFGYMPTNAEEQKAEQKRQKLQNWNKICKALGTMTHQAGFDLSEISAVKWRALCDEFHLAEGVKTEKGWLWSMPRAMSLEHNYVMTANNPITGWYYHNNLGFHDRCAKGYVGYVGIEGDETFVFDFFHRFFEECDGYKEAVFGRRPFI